MSLLLVAYNCVTTYSSHTPGQHHQTLWMGARASCLLSGRTGSIGRMAGHYRGRKCGKIYTHLHLPISHCQMLLFQLVVYLFDTQYPTPPRFRHRHGLRHHRSSSSNSQMPPPLFGRSSMFCSPAASYQSPEPAAIIRWCSDFWATNCLLDNSLDIKQHVPYCFMPGGIVRKYLSNCLSLKISLTVRNIWRSN